MAKVLLTGGAGFIGAALVPKLLAAGHSVLVYDIGYFGLDHFAHTKFSTKLRVKLADIRKTDQFYNAAIGYDTVIHLAAISNDASFELDERLSETTNLTCFEPMVMAAKLAGVGRFIYASSSSVYGVSDAPDVTEDHPLKPLTLYNDYKGRCEPLLFKHRGTGFETVVIRPATVCGYSPRMRLDLSVNLLTIQALETRAIKVLGGDQMRPNLHIDDMCRLYLELLDAPAEKVDGQTFNVGHENLTIRAIAEKVRDIVEMMVLGKPIVIETEPSNDQRSYHISSEKIERELGFKAHKFVSDAVADIVRAWTEGKIPNAMTDTRYRNVARLKEVMAA